MLRPERVRARGGLAYVEPRFDPWVYGFMRSITTIYLRLADGVSRVQTEGIGHLVEAYGRFHAGKARLLLAFRHPTVHDPMVVGHLVSRMLPPAARAHGVPVGRRTHVHFVYGRNVLIWHGGAASFIIPRLAGVPVMNRRTDSQGMRDLRRYLLEGPFPMALGPEGQVSYHNHRLGPVESGTAHLALWASDELRRKGDPRDVLILPLAPVYHFDDQPERTLGDIAARFAARTGIPVPAEGGWRERLLSLTDALLTRLETLYGRFYPLSKAASAPAPRAALQARIERLCDAALRVPESFMGLRPEGDLLTRVFAVRQHGWDYLFRGDLPDHPNLAPLERVLADRLADEAYLQLRHNELVDVLEYLRPDYIDLPTGPGDPSAEPSLNRLIEYALNLLDLVNRLSGGDIGQRYCPRNKRVMVRIGQALSVGAPSIGQAPARRVRLDGLTAALVDRLQELSVERPERPD